jgi:hypothetical protein
MSTTRRPPYWQVPYPNPTTAWLDLPQAVRDAWVDFALGNVIGYIDGKTVQRSATDAYDFMTQMDAAANGGTTPIVYPPELVPPQKQMVAQSLTEISILDTLSLATNIANAGYTQLLVWATPPAAAPGDIDGHLNQFIGAFEIPVNTNPHTFLGDLGSNYVAKFGSVAAKLGQFVVLWAFGCINGNLTFAGSATVEIKSQPAFGCQFYWPMNELFGNNTSLGQPSTAIEGPGAASVAGVIDTATSYLDNTVPTGAKVTPSPTTTINGSFSVSFWGKQVGAGLHVPMLSSYDVNTGTFDFWCFLDTTFNRFDWYYWDGAALTMISDGAAGPVVLNTWYHVVFVYDAATSTIYLYRDGTNALLQTPKTVLNRTGSEQMWIGGLGGANTGAQMQLCEVSWWNRALSAGEVANLYNGGAGLRYPFN